MKLIKISELIKKGRSICQVSDVSCFKKKKKKRQINLQRYDHVEMAELFERKMLLNLSLLKVRIIVFFLFQQCLIFLQTKYASHTTKCVLTVAYMLAGKIWGISWILKDTSIQVSLTLVWRNLNKQHCMEKSHNYHFFIVQLILN